MPVYKDKKNNKWYARFNYTDPLGNHKQKWTKYYETKREAQEAEARMQIELKLNAHPSYTFDEIHKAYVEDQKKIVKPITASHYDPMYSHIKPFIGSIRIDKLTMAQYKAIKEKLDEVIVIDPRIKKKMDKGEKVEIDENKKLSTSRKNRIHKHIVTLCKYALMNYGVTSTVPQACGGFKDPGKIEESGIKFITEEQFKKFIKQFDSDIVFRSLFTMLFYQGLRQGEALALTWDDVDFANNELKINKTYTGKINRAFRTQKYYITSPKTKNSNRIIPMNKHVSECLKMLQDHYRAFDQFKNEWFVFGGPYPMSETSIQVKKDEAIKKSGIDRITIHQFRHSCASYLFDHGADPVSVQHFLGHSKLSTTMDIYVHLRKDKLKNIFDFEDNSEVIRR